MKIISVVGARPNFMKIAAFADAIQTHNSLGKAPYIHHKIIHTGQHYDERMTDTFFRTLSIPKPDLNLHIGSGSHAEQVGNTMIAFEKALIADRPDWVVVLGDVNATLACSIAAAKLQIKVCHIEAGLRSDDFSMPEEINRIITDRISSLLLTPDLKASENLRKEGIPDEKIKFVGNIMIDTLNRHLEKAKSFQVEEVMRFNSFDGKSSIPKNYVLLTLHRPSNVDDNEAIKRITSWVTGVLSKKETVIWVVHPRTEAQLKKLALLEEIKSASNVILLHPLDYLHMLKLSSGSKLIVTDSGGLQEEATVLGKPCLVLRPNTERPLTLAKNGGACLLVDNQIDSLNDALDFVSSNEIKPQIPDRWDGKTSERCLEALLDCQSKISHG